MKEKCQEMVDIRDQLRVSHGRTASGRSTKQRFTMRYIHRRCRRSAKYDGYCFQHRRGGDAK